MEELTAPEIDFVIVADRAEAVNGRLYMMGGGFDRLFVRNFAAEAGFDIALGILVPWSAANEEHRVAIAIEHEDGRPIQDPIEFAMNVGRPPQAIRGQAFRTIVAIHGVFKFPEPGAYCVSARIGDKSPRRAVFYALAANANAVGPQPPGGPQ
jgi:hypothetical protein